MAEIAEQVSEQKLPRPVAPPAPQAFEPQVRIGPFGTLVSDGGKTVEAIRARLSQRLPQRVRVTIEGICRMNDVTFERGAVSVLVPRGGDVVDAVERVRRVCARISRLKT